MIVAMSLTSLGISSSCSKASESRATGGASGTSGAGAPSPSGGSGGASGGSGEQSGASNVAQGGSQAVRRCSRAGWSALPALGSDCLGVCQPDSLAQVPKLEFAARSGWCQGCLLLQTPWATATPEAAVAGGIRGYGPGPDWVNIGIWLDDGKTGIVGLYDAGLKATAGFFVDTVQSQPCGRLASVKFSGDGELGAHLVSRIGEAQRLYVVAGKDAPSLFDGEPRFTWTSSVVGRQAINDMWFSSDNVAMDLSGSTWIGQASTALAVEVQKLPGAPAGEYSHARVQGSDVLVSNWSGGRTRWLAYTGGKLRALLGDTGRDIRDLVTDGKVIVWLEGSQPTTPANGVVQFARYDLMKSPYQVDAKLLQPSLLAANVPPLSNLVLANGYVAGIYLPDAAVVRAAAFVVGLVDGQARRYELPNNYSWGYELYPAEAELWGAITAGPMVTFETVLRVPYSQMETIP